MIELNIITKNKHEVAETLNDSYSDIALLWLAKKLLFQIWLVLSILCSLTELVLVAFPDYYWSLYVQISILSLSSFLFFSGFIAVMITISPKDDEEISFFKRFKATLANEVWIEILTLSFGWGFIFVDIGIASIRILRIFRFFWYSKYYKAKHDSRFFVFTYYCHLVLEYLESIAQEFFTTSSKGGTVILSFFFFLAYTTGVIFWIETRNLPLSSPEGGTSGTLSQCDTLAHCFLIMLRITFWDGDGFDYLKSLMDYNLNGLVVLLIIYMCISAMVLLNGMIGIFSSTINRITEKEDERNNEDPETDISILLFRIENNFQLLSHDISNLRKIIYKST
jgi:hypothetical protein